MTEKQFRVQCIKRRSDIFEKKRVAIYGTGKNAEAILEELQNVNFITLIDRDNVGKYIYGKKVLSLEDALFLDLDLIVIAAEAQAEKKIIDRIGKICKQNNIQLLNMYGVDIYSMIKEDITQDIFYRDLSIEKVKKQIQRSDAVCFELMRVLCETSYYSAEAMWKEIEKKYQIVQFYKNRQRAERERDIHRVYHIVDIYFRYLANTYGDSKEIDRIREMEEKCFLESIIPKGDMPELLNQTVKSGKKVFIVSDLPYTEKTVKDLLRKVGISPDIQVIQENLMSSTLSGGMLRIALDQYFDRKILYIGSKDSLGYHMAGSYGMDRCMIKSSWDHMKDLSMISIKEKDASTERSQVYKEWAVKEYASPFFNEKGKVSGYPLGELYEDDVFEGEGLDLLEVLDSDKKEDFAPISFSQSEQAEVSIIIPVHDHFGYTYACLSSILANTINVDYEVIIADDRSTDLTAQIEDIVKGMRVIHNTKNLFFLKNCNNAAKYAKGKYILFLNNDTQVRYNWLCPLVDLMDKDEDIGLVGSKLIFPDGRLQEAGGIVWSDGKAANYGRGKDHRSPEFNYVKEVDYLSGASIMISKDLWKELDGFDERFEPAYYEDTDLAFKVRRYGKKVVYQPASVVVHFEGISNGRDMQKGIKRYQAVNETKFIDKWKNELLGQEKNEDIFTARERKQDRKVVLFISGHVPTYDKDAGSKSILNYLKLFLEKKYIVKFLPLDFYGAEPYTWQLQQMGIEVLYGDQMKNRFNEWIIKNQMDIDYAFVNYPDPAYKIIDLLRLADIKVRYFGHDLHFLRLRRQYEINSSSESLQASNIFLKKEEEIINKAECVYYPSEVEVEIVKTQFGKENVKQISLYMYEDVDMEEYDPEKREGMMFIGGSHHPNEDAMLWFLTEIYPQVYRERKIPFYLVGADQSPKIKHLNVDGMINLGYLSEDELNDLYHKVRMVVIPLRFGAGIKGKVVDALYHGVPIVSTSIGIEGIPTAETVIGASDTSEEFKERIIELYDDCQALKEISDYEKRLVKTFFSVEVAWEKIKEDF